jgi:hypothetical protein
MSILLIGVIILVHNELPLLSMLALFEAHHKVSCLNRPSDLRPVDAVRQRNFVLPILVGKVCGRYFTILPLLLHTARQESSLMLKGILHWYEAKVRRYLQ